MQNFSIIAITPAGAVDPSLAIAACRAGARGVLDLEYAGSLSAAVEALEQLERFTSSPFGIKISPACVDLLAAILPKLPQRLSAVILTRGNPDQLRSTIEALHSRGASVLLEVTSSVELMLADGLELDGLVLKGQESGGRIGDPTAFVLLQQWRKHIDGRNSSAATRTPPVWVQGGIGPNTAAACMVAGAAGVVLDAQLLLARESPLGDADRLRLAAFDGSETICLGQRLDEAYRFCNRPASPAVEKLTRTEERLLTSGESPEGLRAEWRQAIREQLAADGQSPLLLLGQDIALAKSLADRYVTVAGILQAIRDQVQHNLEVARRLQPLAAGAPLAESHGTKYPIVQGPMTRVSDTAAFAASVAEAGGLPFLALALLRRAETEKLLAETHAHLGKRPWGVGILGFLPPEIRKEQLEAIKTSPPPFALIAGGRPDQARELEQQGIPTYLHVPSPGLLRMFLRDGARRFIFEGRECGGHVGPRSSFLLWETMCEILLAHLGPTARGEDLHIVFAGGIHDALSGAMLSALAAPLAERGVKIGALMGTAYLFTQEAVASGAIVPRFQQEALRCDDTVLLETAPGHAIRCIKTPYFQVFESEKQRLRGEGKNHEEVTRALEWMNIGRLRVASKGLDRIAAGDESPKLSTVSEQEQYDRGMYMIGQVAGLRNHVISMAELHDDVTTGGTRMLDEIAPEIVEESTPPKPCDIAIVGMSCFYPGANNVVQYWENILNRVYAVTEVPATHWDWQLYYDANPQAPDKIVSKWGGFLQDVPFDPFTFGITPKSMTSIEPLQLLLLEGVRHALTDAGYTQRPFNRERTAAILGIGGGGSPLAVSYGFRTCLPLLDLVPGSPVSGTEILNRSKAMLPEWTEDSFPGILMNVAVGRVSNRFNFGGPNFAIDAACASSLAAVHECVRELEMGTSDVAVAMGADTVQTPYAYMAFSKTHALSRRGKCSPFDAAADGIVLSEGIGVVVLKRLADAERDGDQIYAVIKGIGASSDGREKGLTAPNASGQLRALRRAYDKAGISPSRVALIEAHGTGTVVGDQTEGRSLAQVLEEAGADTQSCALGSVKSMIGHSKCAAGLAGLIKTALAIHHKVLPPTLVETPNPKANFEQSPLYLNTEARPWIHGRPEPRCAGVSAFGFGGTNFHVVLEEYTGSYLQQSAPAMRRWPAELFVWRRATRAALVEAIEQCRAGLARGAQPQLNELAAAVWKANPHDHRLPTLAVVATSLDDLGEKLRQASDALKSSSDRVSNPQGIYFADRPTADGGKVAFLFPGQGSQYPNMLSQLAVTFPEVQQAFDQAERVLDGSLEHPLGRYICPPSAFTPEQEQVQRTALARTDVAQPAIGAASLGMLNLLRALGVSPDVLGGHSYGEYVALCAAGALGEEALIQLSHSRGRAINAAAADSRGAMAAIEADAATVEKALAFIEGITLANRNSPQQTVISGSERDIAAAIERFKDSQIRGQRIPVACAFHSPLVAAARDKFAPALSACGFAAPRQPVFSNTTSDVYPANPAAITATLVEHITSPVRFQEEIEAMYAAGARTFVEVGPHQVLTGLVHQILKDKPHVAVATDVKGRPGLVQLLHTLGQLLAAGADVHLDRLFQHRGIRLIDLDRLDADTGKVKHTPSTWMVNSVRNRPLNAPEPLLLGQRRADAPDLFSPAPKSPEKQELAKQNARTAPAATPPAAPVNRMHHSRLPMPAPTAMPDTTRSLPPVVPNSNGNGHAHAHSLPPAAPVADESAQVVLRFQDLMAKFLETQRSVMLTYLQGGGAGPPNPASTSLSEGMLAPHQNGHAHPAAPNADRNVAPPPQAVELQPAEAGTPEGPSDPPVSTAAPPGVASADNEPPTRARLEAQLLDLVSQRTGYPKEMLTPDLDLEADLGVDSIKRVEIMGGLAEGLGTSNDDLASKIELEKLTGLRTIRGILDYLEQALSGSTEAGASSASATEAQPDVTDPTDVEIQRGLVTLVDAPLPSGGSMVIPSGTVLITDDGRGVARELAGRLADFGQRTVLIRMAKGEPPRINDDVCYADLTNPDAVAELLARLRRSVGPIAGLAHLLPLAEPPKEESWTDRTRREVKSLYLLARGLEDDLRRAGTDGDAVLLAATNLGGGLGFADGPLPESFFAGQGGILGFIKCLGMEWPEVLVRAIDLDGGRPAGELVDCLVGELGDANGPLEIGYLGQRRVTWEPISGTFDAASASTLPAVEKGDAVLITGGARGITAAVALELGRRWQPNLVLVGRSPMPEATESTDTASLATAAEIKAALIARCDRDGTPVAPAAIESAYQRLLQDREIRANLARIRETGAGVHYYQADVRDEQAFGGVIDEIEQRFGGVAGVIHGAGVIEDKLIRDKTPESFDRVFSTKVDSAAFLARRLRPERLKFCVFFSSIASRYGNKGQADYAAANEVLSKLAAALDRRWPGRVVAMAWGPWSGVGMVSELKKHLVRRGLKLISPEAGPVFVVDELTRGRKGQSEVLIAGGAQRAVRPPRTGKQAPADKRQTVAAEA